MTAFLEKMGFHRALRFAHGVHEPQAVLDRHGRIIERMDEERGRRIRIDVTLGGAPLDVRLAG